MALPIVGTVNWTWLFIGVGMAMFVFPFLMSKFRGVGA